MQGKGGERRANLCPCLHGSKMEISASALLHTCLPLLLLLQINRSPLYFFCHSRLNSTTEMNNCKKFPLALLWIQSSQVFLQDRRTSGCFHAHAFYFPKLIVRIWNLNRLGQWDSQLLFPKPVPASQPLLPIQTAAVMLCHRLCIELWRGVVFCVCKFHLFICLLMAVP